MELACREPFALDSIMEVGTLGNIALLSDQSCSFEYRDILSHKDGNYCLWLIMSIICLNEVDWNGYFLCQLGDRFVFKRGVFALALPYLISLNASI